MFTLTLTMSPAWGQSNPSLLQRRTRPKPKPAPSPSPSVRPASKQLTVSVGVSSMSYVQTGLSGFSAILVTPKVDYRMPLGASRWSLGANAFGTALSLSSEYPEGTNGIRFIGANWRLGYRLTRSGPWAAEIAAGTYFDTMLVSGTQFGYQNLVGPQAFLRVGRAIGNSLVSGYAKYALMSNGLAFSSGSSQVASGLSWSRRAGPGQLVLQGDFARLAYAQESSSVEVTTLSLSSGFAFGF